MIGYVNKKKLLAKMKDEVEFNWNMQKRYSELAATLKDASAKNRYLDMSLEYIQRWNESVRIYNMLELM